MAYVPDQNDPNQPASPAPGSAPMPATSNTGAGSPQGVTAVKNANQAPPVQDLKAYLTANQPQAVQMGQNIAGNLAQTRQGAVGDVNAAQAGVDKTIQGQTVAPDSGLATQAATNPTDFIKNPENVTKFQQQRDATYTGPTSFESTPEYKAAQGSVQRALSKAPDINQEFGVQQLARGQEQNPTTGMSNLDALLLQETPGALSPIQEEIARFSELNPLLSGAATKEDQAIQNAVSEANASRQGVQDAFLTGPNAVAPTFQMGLNKELQTNVGQVNSYNKAIDDLIAKENEAGPTIGNLSSSVKSYNDALASDLTAPPTILRRGQVANSSPLNLSEVKNPDYLKQPTLAQSATPQDIATQQALETLLGSAYTPAFDATGQTPFSSPGSSPTLQTILDPVLSEIEGQQGNINPKVWNYNPTGHVTTEPIVNYGQNIQDAISALKKYLGENT